MSSGVTALEESCIVPEPDGSRGAAGGALLGMKDKHPAAKTETHRTDPVGNRGLGRKGRRGRRGTAPGPPRQGEAMRPAAREAGSLGPHPLGAVGLRWPGSLRSPGSDHLSYSVAVEHLRVKAHRQDRESPGSGSTRVTAARTGSVGSLPAGGVRAGHSTSPLVLSSPS